MKPTEYIAQNTDLLDAIDRLCARKAEELRDILGDEGEATQRIARFVPASRSVVGRASEKIVEFTTRYLEAPEGQLSTAEVQCRRLTYRLIQTMMLEQLEADPEFLTWIQLKIGAYLDGSKSLAHEVER